MSTATYISNEERETLRRMRAEGRTINELVILTGRSNTSIHQIVQDVETVIILWCGWCHEQFAWHPQRGRPPGYCCENHRYKAALQRKRDARAKESS